MQKPYALLILVPINIYHFLEFLPSSLGVLLPVPLSTLGGWHLGAHKALSSVASTIAARGLSTFSCARSILSQRHAAQLVTNSALCLMSGLFSDI